MHFVRPGATGANTGNNWTDAWTHFPDVLVRGDTYFLAAGTYLPYDFSTPAIGTNMITIKKATQNDHGTEVGWSPAYGSGQAVIRSGASSGILWALKFSTSNWTLDGQSRESFTNGHGFKVIGPPNGGQGVNIGAGVSNIIVQSTELQGHLSTAPLSGGPSGDNAIWFEDESNSITVSNCYVHDWGGCMIKTYTGSISNSVFAANWFVANRNSPKAHSEGVFAWGQRNNIWRHNVWVNIEGTGVIMLGNGGGNQIYGNLVYWDNSYPKVGQEGKYIGNGVFTNWEAYRSTNNLFYHNTIVLPVDGGINFGINFLNTQSSGFARNNLYFCPTNRTVPSLGVDSDYDVFYGVEHDSQAHGYDAVGDPFVNTQNQNFRLKSHTQPGVNLGKPFDFDLDGKVRSVWDRGAFEY